MAQPIIGSLTPPGKNLTTSTALSARRIGELENGLKPLGQHTARFPCKKDCHPPKGWVNWWESEIDNDENKSLEKRLANKDIREQLDSYFEIGKHDNM